MENRSFGNSGNDKENSRSEDTDGAACTYGVFRLTEDRLNGESNNQNIHSQYLRARYYDTVKGNFLTEDSYLGDVLRIADKIRNKEYDSLARGAGYIAGNIAQVYAISKGIEKCGELLDRAKMKEFPSASIEDYRYRIGKPVNSMEKTLEMGINPELYANEVAKKYGINLKGSGQELNHARSYLRGGCAPENGIGGAYAAGDALAEYIRGER